MSDPFGYPTPEASSSEPEEEFGTQSAQPGGDADAPQAGAASPHSFEGICANLLQTGAVETSIAHDSDQYRVETKVERNKRRLTSAIRVFFNSAPMNEPGFVLEKRSVEAKPDEEGETQWEQFVQDAARKHLEKCKQVRQRIAETSEDQRTGGLGKKIGKILLFLLVALSLLLNVVGGYLYFERDTLKNLLGLSDSAPLAAPDMPALRLEYATIRGNVHEENGLPTITLTKTDMVTVNVVNQATGEVLHSGLMNINLAH